MRSQEFITDALVHRAHVGSSDPNDIWHVRDENTRKLRSRRNQVVLSKARPVVMSADAMRSRTYDTSPSTGKRYQLLGGFHYAYLQGDLKSQFPDNVDQGRELRFKNGRFIYADTQEPFTGADYVHFASDRSVTAYNVEQGGDKLKEALHFVRPGELRGSYTDADMISMGFRRAKNGVWYIDQRRWDALLQRGQLREINANDELTVSQQIEDYFFKRGYQFAGEGRDQMAFVSPRNTVVKVLGIGDPEREKIVKDYVAFFVRNQRNPYYPRIYNTGEFTLNGETYFVYEMEYLNYVANEEATLEYLEDLMNAAARGYADAYQQNNPMPPELDEGEVQGLLLATEDLIDALGGYAPLDLSNIENLRRRSNGHLVIMDPFSL